MFIYLMTVRENLQVLQACLEVLVTLIFKSYIIHIDVCHGKRFSNSCDAFLFWLYT